MTARRLTELLDTLADGGRCDLADELLTVLADNGLLPELPPDDAGPAQVGGTPALAVAA